MSSLWAAADPQVAAQIERPPRRTTTHPRFPKEHALFTREGPQGIRQVNVRGLIAAAFTHRDSRSGDPDLHTHVAVANKVQTLGGGGYPSTAGCCSRPRWPPRRPTTPRWSATLRDRLGCGCGSARHGSGKQPVREIVGVDPALNQRWSTRRVLIKTRQGELAARFQRDHGRPPTRWRALQLAQQAHLGDPGRQTRTPHPGRAAHSGTPRPPRPSADLKRSRP